MLYCISEEDHRKQVQKVKRRARRIHLAGICFALGLLLLTAHFYMERALTVTAYRIIRGELDSFMDRYHLLQILRTKSLTVGQAMDIADIVMDQKDVPFSMVLAVIEQESRFKAEAISPKGARGLMQVMPVVWNMYINHSLPESIKGNPHDPAMNVRVGLRYLTDLKDRFGTWEEALRAYYGGPDRADDPKVNPYAREVLKKAAFYAMESRRD